MDEENMLQLYQNRYDETDPSSAEAREACFSPQEMRGPADINRVVVPIVDQQDARRSHATDLYRYMAYGIEICNLSDNPSHPLHEGHHRIKIKSNEFTERQVRGQDHFGDASQYHRSLPVHHPSR